MLSVEAVDPADAPARRQASELWAEYMAISVQELVELIGYDLGIPDEASGEVSDPTSHYDVVLVARLDGRAVGSAGLERFDERWCELKRLYVRPEARRRGVARALVERSLEEARRLGYQRVLADTLVSRPGAIDLFRSLGFREVEPWRTLPIPLVYQALDV